MLYSKEHVWVKEEKDTVRIGLSDFAQTELGELTFIELPQPGSHFGCSEVICSIDSLKAASDIYAPLSGTVESVNASLNESEGASLINRDPLGAGWILTMKPDDENYRKDLLSPEDYRKYTGSE